LILRFSSANGPASTSYGFTGEHTEPTGDIYLRARHYAPEVGRFITKDTWKGDAKQPRSYNLWNYTYSNPINLTDPSGHKPPVPNYEWCVVGLLQMTFIYYDMIADIYGLCTVTKLMEPKPGDYINTYTAAGVAIQSQWYTPWVDSRGSLYYRFQPHDFYGSGLGLCNISDAQMQTAWGKKIPGNDGFGLGLIGLDQEDPKVAVEAMKRRILLVTEADICTHCSSTDIFIAAALAQNSDLFPSNMKTLRNKYRLNPLPSDPKKTTFDWNAFFKDEGAPDHVYRQIKSFKMDVQALHDHNEDWYVPDIDWTEIDVYASRAHR